MSAKGWTVVKSRPKPVPRTFVDIPREEWLELADEERDIYNVLREKGPLSAKDLAARLNEMHPEEAGANTVQSVGDLLYEGDIKEYVERIGPRGNRLWRVRSK
jgi:hypothetical protein